MTLSQAAVDTVALRALLSRYAHAIDRHDYAMLGSIFTGDAYFEFNGGQVINRNLQEITRMMQSLERNRITQHFLGTQIVEVQGDAAKLEAYGEAHHFTSLGEGKERDRVFGVRYLHEAARVKGQWRVQRTIEVVDYRRDNECIQPGPQREITGWRGYQGDPTPEQAFELVALRELTMRYSHSLDRRDPAVMESVFAPDAFFEFNNGVAASPGGNGRWNGLEEIKRIPVGLRRYLRTMHTMGPQYVELDGERARMETYGEAHHLVAREDGTELDRVFGLRYIAEVEKVRGDWRIKRQDELIDWRRDDICIRPEAGRQTAR